MNIPLATGADLTLLDCPIFNALLTRHALFAEGNDRAKRYPPAIGPLAGMRDSSFLFDALAEILPIGETAAQFLDDVPVIPDGWTLIRQVPLTQMICAQPVDVRENSAIEPLNIANVDEMLALVELTQPGPFGKRTPELGTYLGIRDGGKLVAMAGERLQLPGYTEISAVCTHPDYRGRGFANSLISSLIQTITQRGDVPFLHTASENLRAIRVYEGLGFQLRRSFVVVVLRRDQ